MSFDFYRLGGKGTQLTLGATTVTATLPTTSASGNNAPKFVRLAASSNAYVLFYNSAAGAPTVSGTNFHLLVNTAEAPIVSVQGYDSVAALQQGTGGILTVTPVEA